MKPLKTKMQKLNPFNYLFGRVFLWFWLALLVIVLSGFFLARQLSTVFEINAVSKQQLASSGKAVDRLERLLARDISLNLALRRAGDRGKIQLVMVNDVSGEFRGNFPPEFLGRVDRLEELRETSSPVLISLNNMQFVGPYKITHRTQSYSLFVGRLLLREERDGASRSTAAIAGLSLAILLSTIFCFVLVLSIARPIGALRKATNKLTDGDLSSRISGFDKRRDEIGLLADDFNSMATRLQQVVENQKQLMANVSHELRTPLTRLQLCAALLEDELIAGAAEENQVGQKQLSRIHSEIEKMDEMIGQALTIAKLNSSEGSLPRLTLGPVEPSVLLGDLLSDASFEAKANNKDLNIGELPSLTLNVDSQLISSAVENILRNGLRFAKQQVCCQFSLQLDEATNTTNQKLKHSYFCIRISDDGEGIPEPQRSQIFEPFFRGMGQDQQTTKGAGLGLAIAKAAIEAHGGDICAETSHLGGLSVIIRLPVNT
jgi:two-component system sensor histidine kinase CpxA